jgi:archaeal flagellar protein FlaJ
MALRGFQRTGYRLFGRLAGKRAQENPRLRTMLQRAHITVRPDVYLASGYLALLSTAGFSMVIVLLLVVFRATGLLVLPLNLLALLVPVPILLALSLYFTLLILPDLRAASRARSIDAKLPYALNYIATMASAGATPQKIFGALAGNDLYGEVRNEAAWIYRDLNLLGLDIVTALNHAIDRSPSIKFQDFLQGAITALTSGGDLKDYFLQKSEQFLFENRQEQGKFLDSLGVLAESFVTVVVAAPLFLIVLLSVMTSFGSSPREVLTIGYSIIFILLPLSQLGFALTIKSMTPED